MSNTLRVIKTFKKEHFGGKSAILKKTTFWILEKYEDFFADKKINKINKIENYNNYLVGLEEIEQMIDSWELLKPRG